MAFLEIAAGVLAKAVPGCGVAAFALRAFAAQDVVLKEAAQVLSAVDVPRKDQEIYRALCLREEKRREIE